ncbi:MAG: ATP-binding protein [Deltaproteobacteria bacterium]
MMQRRGGGTLFRRYLVVFLLLVGGVLMAAGATELYFTYQETKRALVRIEREKAFAAAERIDLFVKDIQHRVRATMRAIADDASVAGLQRPNGEYRETLAAALTEQREMDFVRLLRNAPSITEARYLDIAGREQIRVSRFALDAIGSSEDFGQTAAYRTARAGKTYLGPMYFRNESEPYVTLAVPADASALEVIAVDFSLKALWDIVSRIRVGHAGFAYVVDEHGRLIAHPDVGDVLRGRDISDMAHFRAARADAGATGDSAMVADGLGGGRVLVAHAIVPAAGWIVFIEQPLAEAFAPLEATLVRGAIILAGGLLAAVLASIALARGLVAPIRELGAGAQRIGNGDLDHRIEVRTGDELQTLGDEFNRMGARLADSYRDLENKIATRTAELSQSVAELRALADVSQAINSTLDVQRVLEMIVTHAVRLSAADAGTIYVYDETAEVFLPQANFGLGEAMVAALRDSRITLGDTVVGRCALQRRPMQIPDLDQEPVYRLYDLVRGGGFRALIGVPLIREECVVGALVIRRREAGEYPATVVRTLETLAAQSVLAIQNARLFHEIEEKGRQLEVASRHKSEFLANMSHELRTPLNAIIGFSEVLSERMFGDINEKQAEYLADILESGRHLLSLINDILDLSKIEAGRMELETSDFDLPRAIESTLILIRERAHRRGIALASEVDPQVGTIRADERKVKQVLLNLLSNALKFTPENGRIAVRAALRDAAVEVSVTDTGVGIAPEDQAAVFEEFRQVGAAARKIEGTGLGLAISRRFIELHGGRIELQSAVGAGSTFTFSLPLA